MPEISAKKLASLLSFGDQTKTKLASISGEYRERIKDAVEKDHLHGGAYGLILKLARKDEENRDEFLRQFDLMRDMCDEHQLWGETHTGDLVDKAEGTTIGSAAANIIKSNVATLKGGVKQLPDEGPSDYAKGERVPARARRPGPAPQKAGHAFGVSADPLTGADRSGDYDGDAA